MTPRSARSCRGPSVRVESWPVRLRGAWLVTSWHDYPAGLAGRTERALLEWFAQNVHQGETWLDVGAHYGYTTIALGRLVGSHGRVFTFEPVPATRRLRGPGARAQ